MGPNNKIVTIHQPQYFPYLGFFNKISHSDIYVVLDDVSNYKGDFTNRNRIKSPQGAIWLTVPLNRNNKIIKDIKIKDNKWVNKHLKSLNYNYSKSLFYESVMTSIRNLLESNHWSNLIDLNMQTLELIFKLLDIKVELIFSSSIPKFSKGSERLIEIIKHVKCNKYIAGPGSKDYLDELLFEKNKIQIINQEFKEKKYKQQYGNYEPNLSVLDSLFNVGLEEVRNLIK